MAPPRTPAQPISAVPDTPPSAMGGSSSDTTLADALLTLRKRRWVLVVAGVLGLIYGIYRALSLPKLYESYGRIEVRAGSSNQYRVTPGYDSADANKLLTEVAILSSDSLMLSVARQMNLNNNADFLEVKGPVPHTSLDDPAVRQDTINQLQAGLSIQLVPKTDIIRISYDALNPKLATDIVNTVISSYIQRSYETRFRSTQRVSQWLSGQLDDLKQQVETSQEQVMELQRRLGILGFDPTHNQISSSLEDLSRAQGAARLARIVAESRYRVLAGMDPDTMEGSLEATPGTSPGELNGLRAQIATAKASYAQMTAPGGLGPNNPTAVALRAQIAELQREITTEQNRLLVQAKQAYVIAQANENQTSEQLEKQKSDAYKLRDDLVEYTIRQREFETNRTLYEGLSERLRTAGVQAGLESLEIDVVDQALLPASPLQQSQSSLIITTIVFALMGGVVVAFLLESLDTGLRSISEIEAVTDLPSLAVIPRSRRSTAEQASHLSTAQRNIGLLTQPKSQFAEAFRSLRTSLLLSTVGHAPRRILFTSATPSEGKTTVATNLATVLAQSGEKVLIIDADLRRPAVHHRFGLNGRVGLTTLLTGATKFEETLQRVPEIPNLDVLPSGPVPPLPTEMLSSEAMNALLARCAELYTYVVIDSPPILSVTDGVILARDADAVVLVVRHGKSSKQIVRRARDLLIRSGAPITGVVLNAVDLRSPEYYGYYGYSSYAYASADSGSWEPTSSEGEAEAQKRTTPDGEGGA